MSDIWIVLKTSWSTLYFLIRQVGMKAEGDAQHQNLKTLETENINPLKYGEGTMRSLLWFIANWIQVRDCSMNLKSVRCQKKEGARPTCSTEHCTERCVEEKKIRWQKTQLSYHCTWTMHHKQRTAIQLILKQNIGKWEWLRGHTFTYCYSPDRCDQVWLKISEPISIFLVVKVIQAQTSRWKANCEMKIEQMQPQEDKMKH